MSESRTAARQAAGSRVREVARRLAWEMEQEVIPIGDLAMLRRIRPGQLGGPAFWKIAVQHLEPAGVIAGSDAGHRQRRERQWCTILAAMAAGPPQSRRPLGRALAEAAVTEARVLRLLRARDEALLDTARTVVHQLGSGGAAFDWGDLAELVCSDGEPEAEAVRRTIAYDYYRQQRMQARGAKEEEQ